MNKVIIVGGGAAGMLASVIAARNGCEVLLFEKNEKLGKKVYITGKGRCNVTNNCDPEELLQAVMSNPKFLYSAFYSFTSQDMMHLLEEAGVPLKTERGNRVFPVSDHSSDIIHGLERLMKKYHVQIRLHCEVLEILTENGIASGVKLKDHTVYTSDSVIVATGGLSYPTTGSTGDGYRFATETGHKVTECIPSLVPLTTREDYIPLMKGLSLRNVELTIKRGKKTVYQDFGEMMFTHFGLTGPTILSLSHTVGKLLRKKNPQITIEINLKPALTAEVLDKRLQKDFDLYSKKQLANGMKDLLPVNLIPIVINLAELDPSKPINQITKEERMRLCHVLQHMTLTVKELRPVAEAIVTAGGISLKEFSPKTMESKLVKGLYGAGEVLDIDAFTGGYNLQAAFSTGYVAAMHAVHGDEE